MATKTKGIDFSTLTLKDALDLAVLVEEEARERYLEFTQQMEQHHNPESARFFSFMASNEEKHRAALAGRRAHLFGDAPVTVHAGMIFDVEAPDYDEASTFMTVRGALEAALRAEVKAHDFFVSSLPRVNNREVHALFDELREEEIQHQLLVKRELARAPADPQFKAEEFSDPPVGE
jgi:erythrin-vacuolar iron transport family protein